MNKVKCATSFSFQTFSSSIKKKRAFSIPNFLVNEQNVIKNTYAKSRLFKLNRYDNTIKTE